MTAQRLRTLERQTRALLARLGRASEDHDSMRLSLALGHVAKAADELREAALVAEIRARLDR